MALADLEWLGGWMAEGFFPRQDIRSWKELCPTLAVTGLSGLGSDPMSQNCRFGVIMLALAGGGWVVVSWGQGEKTYLPQPVGGW